MIRKLASAILVFSLLFSFIFFGSANLSVGVKSGDWIEYTVTYTGSPPQGHEVIWARMEVLEVTGTNISVSVTSRFSDGSNENIHATLDLQTGHLIDDFIIPANLNVGDTFLDENYGKLTITAAIPRQYAGAVRTFLSASSGNNTYFWDQATGVSVEGTTATDEYSIHTIAQTTNMWKSTRSFDLATILLVVGVFLIIFVAVLAFTARYLREKAYERRRADLRD